MQGLRQVILVILLLCGIQSGAALVPEDLEISSVGPDSTDWVVAGGSGSQITLQINNAPTDIAGVDFECPDSSLGSLSITHLTSAPYTTKFTPATLSGTAEVTATVWYGENGTESVSKVYGQKIDHSNPYQISSILFENEVTVGGKTPIEIVITDRYNNSVDGLYETARGLTPEEVKFTGSPEDAGFVTDGGLVPSTKVYADEDGIFRTMFRVSETAGENIVSVAPVDMDPHSQWLTIYGIANAEPASIGLSFINPSGSPPEQWADGESIFHLVYTLRDTYGNPCPDRQVSVDVTYEESRVLWTNHMGQVIFNIGPCDVGDTHTVRVAYLWNDYVTSENTVRFVTPSLESIELTATWVVMPSQEVKSGFVAAITARTLDSEGTPIPNQNLNFTIANPEYPDSQVMPPQIEARAETSADGKAISLFTPGTFASEGEAGYNAYSNGACDVIASWDTGGHVVREKIRLKWKNYPYISVETEAHPDIIDLDSEGETVDTDITVRLKGDGWATGIKPIDVMLCTDRSGSMLSGYPDRMVYAKDASKTFIAAMNETRDQVGLVSFGQRGPAYLVPEWKDDNYWNWDNVYGFSRWSWYFQQWGNVARDGEYECNTNDYSTTSDHHKYAEEHYGGGRKDYADYATVDSELLPCGSVSLDSAIDGMVPASGTPLRFGLYKSLNEIIYNNENESANDGNTVRAVIILSDGDYNWYGDPLARGSGSTTSSPEDFGDLEKNYYRFESLTDAEQDLSYYASHRQIKIFSIACGDLSSGGEETLRMLAEGTGGEYYSAPEMSDLADIYTQIAGKLIDVAGADISMDLAFDNVTFNNVPRANTEIFDYQPDTKIHKYCFYNDTTIFRQQRDDSANWTAGDLHFDVGTIKPGQAWQTTLKLILNTDKVGVGGSLRLFSNSVGAITATGIEGEYHLPLPDTIIALHNNLSAGGDESRRLLVSDLKIGKPGPDSLGIGWNVSYTGNSTVTEEVYYQNVDAGTGAWVCFETLYFDGAVHSKSETACLGVKSLPSGRYRFRIYAYADDSNPSEVIGSTVKIGERQRSYIKLE